MWNGGAPHALHAQPTPSRTPAAAPRRPSVPEPPAREPHQTAGNFPGAQLVPSAPPPLRLRVRFLASLPPQPPTAPQPGAGQFSQAGRGALSAGPGLPAPLLGLRGTGGHGRGRCAQRLRRLRCCRLASPRGPVQRRSAGREGERQGGRGEGGRRGEDEREGAGVSRGDGVEEQGAGFPKGGVTRPRTHTGPSLYSRETLAATASPRVRQLK